KLIPLTIIKALEGEKIPVYGTGMNVRDWLYVEDHARAACGRARRQTRRELLRRGSQCADEPCRFACHLRGDLRILRFWTSPPYDAAYLELAQRRTLSLATLARCEASRGYPRSNQVG